MDQAAAGGRGESACAVGDGLHAAAGIQTVPEVALGLGEVVEGRVLQVLGQQAGGDGGGQTLDGAGAVFVLASGERAEGFDQRVGRGHQPLAGAVTAAGGACGDRLPPGVGDVRPCRVREPVEVEMEGEGEGEALAQAGDQQSAAAAGGVGPAVADRVEGPVGGASPVLVGPAVVGVVVGPADGGAHHAVQVVGPQGGSVLADEGPLGQAQGRGLAGHAGRGGGACGVEGVQQGHRAQDVPFVGGEVLGVRVRRISRKRRTARSRNSGRPGERAVITVHRSSPMRGRPPAVRRGVS